MLFEHLYLTSNIINSVRIL